MKNRFFENLGKRVSIGAVISMSDHGLLLDRRGALSDDDRDRA